MVALKYLAILVANSLLSLASATQLGVFQGECTGQALFQGNPGGMAYNVKDPKDTGNRLEVPRSVAESVNGFWHRFDDAFPITAIVHYTPSGTDMVKIHLYLHNRSNKIMSATIAVSEKLDEKPLMLFSVGAVQGAQQTSCILVNSAFLGFHITVQSHKLSVV